jgi:glycolate oxidase FAD binding subunit
VPHPDAATIGGSVAANVSGSRRYGAGTLRDYVIGISTVDGDGVETKAGGRVVKNVAGYDLCKLHTGALGTLGVITQLTLKVRPVPESQALATVGCHDAVLGRLLDALHGSRTRPICLDALNRPAAQRAGLTGDLDWTVVVGYEDSEHAVEWQLKQLIQEMTAAGFGGLEARAGAACDPLWRALAELPRGGDSELTFKANLLPGQVAEFCRGAHDGAALHAHAGSGIVWWHVGPGLTEPSARTMLERLGCMTGGGNLVVTRCPPAWKPTLPVWGTPRGDLGLMRRVKAALDPRSKFNPGRLF